MSGTLELRLIPKPFYPVPATELHNQSTHKTK
jgi:hypothetical protein